jgi:hypothetical protein
MSLSFPSSFFLPVHTYKAPSLPLMTTEDLPEGFITFLVVAMSWSIDARETMRVLDVVERCVRTKIALSGSISIRILLCVMDTGVKHGRMDVLLSSRKVVKNPRAIGGFSLYSLSVINDFHVHDHHQPRRYR